MSPVGGAWNPNSLPVRSGAYEDFVAAVQAATAGSAGTTVVVGTADWGPIGEPFVATNEGLVTQVLPSAWGGELGDGLLQAMAGFDLGGAGTVIGLRIADDTAAAGSLILDAAESSPALKLTAVLDGIRGNAWTVTVQTNAGDDSNCDILLYESGVLIASALNITAATNTAAVAAINANPAFSSILTATIDGDADQALVNISGAAFTGGVSGDDPTVAELTTALATLTNYQFDTIALANTAPGTMLDALVAWADAYNSTTGLRCFAVGGGGQGDTLEDALERSYDPDADTGDYNDADVCNAGLTDLQRLSDGTILSNQYLAPRWAGAIAAIGISRALTGVTWTGYQIASTSNGGAGVPSTAEYVDAIEGGVLCFRQDNVTTVSVEEGCTTLVTTDEDSNPVQHQKIFNVAIDHFVSDQITLMGNAARGGTLNTGGGRTSFIGRVQKMLSLLEGNATQTGSSSVDVDTSYVATGSQLFLKVGYAYLGVLEQFFFTIAVSGG